MLLGWCWRWVLPVTPAGSCNSGSQKTKHVWVPRFHTIGACVTASLRWGTLSNALEKPRSVMSNWSLASMPLARSRTARTSCETQDRFFRKPCCASDKMLWLSRWFMLLLRKMCSSTSQVTDVRETDL